MVYTECEYSCSRKLVAATAPAGTSEPDVCVGGNSNGQGMGLLGCSLTRLSSITRLVGGEQSNDNTPRAMLGPRPSFSSSCSLDDTTRRPDRSTKVSFPLCPSGGVGT